MCSNKNIKTTSHHRSSSQAFLAEQKTRPRSDATSGRMNASFPCLFHAQGRPHSHTISDRTKTAPPYYTRASFPYHIWQNEDRIPMLQHSLIPIPSQVEKVSFSGRSHTSSGRDTGYNLIPFRYQWPAMQEHQIKAVPSNTKLHPPHPAAQDCSHNKTYCCCSNNNQLQNI